jgi:diguanylate cyclase (GGDEF)-like protein
MHILTLFMLVIILVSLNASLEFSYIIALLGSLAAAAFVHRHESFANILFTIAIFNLTPLLCRHFKDRLHTLRSSLQQKKTQAHTAQEELAKRHSLIKRSNLHLSETAKEIGELYKMVRDMSALLTYSEIFDLLGRKLTQGFQFKRLRMILVDEDTDDLAIKKIWNLQPGQDKSNIEPAQASDSEMLQLGLRSPGLSFNEDASALAPLMADNRLSGAIIIEDLPLKAREDFSILANQFGLQFKRVRLYQKLQDLAITDGLTGLFLRRYFCQRVDEEIQRSAYHHLRLSFLMIDIDHFKQCNDKFGHLVGDAVLQEMAKKIKSCLREIDLIARYGGEEFSVLLPNTDKQDAEQIAERIRASIDEHQFHAYDQVIRVKVSIGAASFPSDAKGAQQLIDKADQALYQAKEEGRNRVRLFFPNNKTE